MSEDIKVTDGTVLETLNGKVDIDFDNVASNSVGFARCSTEVTNCITEIPQRIKYTLENGTLTIKAGSVVIVPYGVEDLTAQYPVGATFINDNFKVYDTQFADGKFFVWAEVQSDIVNETTSAKSRTSYITLNPAVNKIYVSQKDAVCGTTYTIEGNGYLYNTKTNIIDYYDYSTGTGLEGVAYAFPLGLVDLDSSSLITMNQVFNGMGYIGSTIWVDKGVKGLIPNGRNEDGTLNNIEFNNNKLATYTTTDGASSEYYISLNNDYIGRLQTISWEYKQDKNQILGIKEANLNMVTKNCMAGLMTLQKGVVTSFQPKQPFRALDYSDKSQISGWAMPSNKYIDLTLGASGTTYTAPANGYYQVGGTTSSQGGFFIKNTNNGLTIGEGTIASGASIGYFMPVKKGAVIIVDYTALKNTNMRFIYAEGEV